MKNILLFTQLIACSILFSTTQSYASATPEHVTCEITGEIIATKTTQHIDHFMGMAETRETNDVSIKIRTSEVVKEASEGKCADLNEIATFSFKNPSDSDAFDKEECIKGTTQFSGSTTFNANWIYDIEKLPVEKCVQ